eukprot:scaffold90735_cov72-Phaeocystis_antarctica.AAC.2
MWRAHGVQSRHEHLLGGGDRDQQRRKARVQGAAACQRGGCAAGHLLGLVPRLHGDKQCALVHAVRRWRGHAARGTQHAASLALGACDLTTIVNEQGALACTPPPRQLSQAGEAGEAGEAAPSPETTETEAPAREASGHDEL